ncbi:MAG: CoA pyrophosphatase [Pseudomonadota bacterium]
MDPYTTLDDFLTRARTRLDPLAGETRLEEGGDIDFLTETEMRSIRQAGVLIGIRPTASGATVFLTERPKTMAKHPGQVAFPGGKVDPDDPDEVAAAVREAHEEVGLPPEAVDLIGRSAPYFTGTGFRIVPVVALVPTEFVPIPEAGEVDEVFETPLEYLMNPDNHVARSTVWKGKARQYYEMPHNGHRIWGVTAGIIRTLHQALYGPAT